MKKKKWLWGLIPLVLIAYLASPVVLHLFYNWGYNNKDLKHMMIIGHRGGASIGPENTLACYQKGIDAGADMIEIDIHLTKDKKTITGLPREGVTMAEDELLRLANEWELKHAGYSGRTARQLIDDILGREKETKEA